MFFIGILFVSNLLAKVVQTGKMIWNKVKKKRNLLILIYQKKQFSLFSKKV